MQKKVDNCSFEFQAFPGPICEVYQVENDFDLDVNVRRGTFDELH